MTVRHPGDILLYDFMIPYEISQNALARSMGVSPRRINEIVNGTRNITAATAVGLEAIIGPTAEFWGARSMQTGGSSSRTRVGEGVKTGYDARRHVL